MPNAGALDVVCACRSYLLGYNTFLSVLCVVLLPSNALFGAYLHSQFYDRGSSGSTIETSLAGRPDISSLFAARLAVVVMLKLQKSYIKGHRPH